MSQFDRRARERHAVLNIVAAGVIFALAIVATLTTTL